MSSLEALFRSAQESAVVFSAPAPSVYLASGADAERYLHGRLTQDVRSLAVGDTRRSLLLTPQGRIQAHLSISREQLGYFLVSDPLPDEEAERGFVSALLQFKVADDVRLERLQLRRLVLVGPSSAELLAQAGLEKIPARAACTSGELFGAPARVLHPEHGAFERFDIFSEQDLSQRFAATAKQGDEETLELIRIAAKIPAMGAEISEKVLGPEIDVEQVASFHKGCYTGQEVVEMSTARGRPNRTLVLFEGTANELPPEREVSFEGETVGRLTSVSYLPESRRLLALGFVKTAAREAESFALGTIALRAIG